MSDFSKIDLEIKAMLMLRHPNVVRLYRVLESNDKVYLVMELCGGGTLADMVHIKPLSEPLARFYMRQLIPAIKYCHKQGVIHRDIKLENLLLTNRGNLKVCPFHHCFPPKKFLTLVVDADIRLWPRGHLPRRVGSVQNLSRGQLVAHFTRAS